ncbi:MAG: asparaginase [Acidimicrobiales bacterium]|nr:asparaginase [Acidimicrobiales bacterium]
MNLDNPIIATLDRAGHTESVHRGAWALVRLGSDGGFDVVDAAGDPTQQIFARSAMKGLQALPVVESGAADAFDFTEAELAIACASHSSEPPHLRTVATMLHKGGLSEDQLRCGASTQWFQGATGQRRRSYHGCSGKHAAMLLTALHRGEAPADYLSPSSQTQRAVRAAVADMTGADLTDGIDGCSAPTFRMPLHALALGLARLTNPAGLCAERAAASDRITAAAAARPEMIGGEIERFDTDLIRATGGRVFTKMGAEGVFVCGVRGSGHGLCLRVDDGTERAIHKLAPRILRDHDLIDSSEFDALSKWASLDRYNADHLHCGTITL